MKNYPLEKNYDRVRVRVSGIYVRNNQLLLIKHKELGEDYLWSPPGGGIDFNTSIEENLIREFLEETGLIIEVGDFLFINEFISPPLHAIELFFKVKVIEGELKLGKDPELEFDNQIITEIKFMDIKELNREKSQNIHNILRNCKDTKDILDLKGYFIFSK